jgi:hypothetical protein
MEYLNLIFVVISALIAHFMPIELLLFAYAFLGPAHYLTEISWLHDRNYFSPSKLIAAILFLCSFLYLISPAYGFLYMWEAIVLTITFTCFKKNRNAILFFIVGSLLFLIAPQGKFLLLIFILLPTLIHVFLFTFLFILNGFLKRKELCAGLTLIAIILATISFFVIDTKSVVLFPDIVKNNKDFFLVIPNSLIQLFNLDSNTTLLNNLFKFTAFAYTFHYLNWFSKTRLLGWYQISNQRRYYMASFYFLLISVYFYNYKLGFILAAFLSILHVVLEFPLNLKVFRDLFNQLK